MIIVPILQIIWYRYENGRRERLAGDRNDFNADSRPEFTDETDFEKWETFRYTM